MADGLVEFAKTAGTKNGSGDLMFHNWDIIALTIVGLGIVYLNFRGER